MFEDEACQYQDDGCDFIKQIFFSSLAHFEFIKHLVISAWITCILALGLCWHRTPQLLVICTDSLMNPSKLVEHVVHA